MAILVIVRLLAVAAIIFCIKILWDFLVICKLTKDAVKQHDREVELNRTNDVYSRKTGMNYIDVQCV